MFKRQLKDFMGEKSSRQKEFSKNIDSVDKGESLMA